MLLFIPTRFSSSRKTGCVRAGAGLRSIILTAEKTKPHQMNYDPYTSFLFLRQQERWPPLGPSVGRKSEWLPVFVGRALGRAFLTFLGGRGGASDRVCAGPRPPLSPWVLDAGVGAAGQGTPPLASELGGSSPGSLTAVLVRRQRRIPQQVGRHGSCGWEPASLDYPGPSEEKPG